MGKCGLIGSQAAQTAISGLNSISNIADRAIGQVDSLSNSLANLVSSLNPVDVDIDLTNAGTLSNPFDIGNAPNVQNITFNSPLVPNVPNISSVNYTETAKPPGDAPDAPPGLNLPNRPSPFNENAPGPAPTVGTYPMPDEPNDRLPPVPNLRPIVIPDFTPLDFPQFTAISPVAPVEIGFGDFNYTDPGYVPTVRTEIVQQIQAILGGSTGIPDLVWDMIEERGRRQARATARQVWEESLDFWANRGHFISTGALRKRMDKASKVEYEATSELIRELVIQDAKIYVERLNTALAEGIALENQLIGLYNAVENRAYEIAKTVFEVRFRMAEYQLSYYNARLEQFRIEAQIYQTLIQAEVAKLEEVKVQLEQQKLVGELNQQELEVYKAQIQAVISKYDLFKVKVDSVVAQYDADKTRVEAFGEEVKAFGVKQQAKESEWRGYGEAVKAEVAVQDSYKIAGEIFGERVKAYSTGIEADKARLEAKAISQRLKLEKYEKELSKAELELRGQSEDARFEGLTEELKVKVFEAAGQVERSRVESDAQRLQVLSENARARMQGQIQETQLKIADAKNLLDSQANALQAILSAQASVGSSALAALNYAATISESAQNSTSCIDRYNTELS